MRTVVIPAVIAAAVAALVAFFVVPKPPEPAPAEPHAEVVARLEALERALAEDKAEEMVRLEGRADAAELRSQAQAARVDALRAELKAMEAKFAALAESTRARAQAPKTPEPVLPAPVDEVALSKEVEGWLEKLRSDNENVAFSATLELGRLKDAAAVPALVETLRTHRDYYVRLGAAAALGDIAVLDAVPGLIEALNDKDALVRTAANDALMKITKYRIPFPPTATEDERRAAQDAWWKWWNENEAQLRAR